MSHRMRLLIGVFALITSACHTEPLPDSFGIYARSGRNLLPLVEAPEDPTQLAVESTATFVLFDNRIAPGQDLTKQIGLIRAIWTRSAVDKIAQRENGQPSHVTSSSLDRWVRWASNISS